MHLAALPEDRASSDPSGHCLADVRRTLDNRAFATAVGAYAGVLSHRGVGPGDVVAVQLANRVELIVALFAAWRLGAAVTPVNPALTHDETEHQVQDAAAVVLIGEAGGHRIDGPTYLVVDELPLDDGADPPGPARTQTDELALVIYTGGTTGRPKGVMLDHRHLDVMCAMIIEEMRLGFDDHSLLILPLFHVNGIVVSVLSPLLAGARTTIGERFDPATFWTTVERVRPTYFSAVPTIYTMLLAQDPEPAPDTSSLRLVVCGAAPMPPDLIGHFEERFDVAMLEGYGLSEGTTASTINPLDGLRKPGTVGRPIAGQQVRIVDEDGTELPAGQPGEVVIQGPNVMRGYLNRPEATAEAIVDGWLHTGDVGLMDEDGYLVLVDRLKDLIIRGGENLYPKEIEGALYQHPAVLEAAVVGAPDPVFGEEVAAFVSLREGHEVTPDELRAHCRQRLAKAKVPRYLEILDELPKTAVGKITKPPLRDRVPTPQPAAAGHRP